MVERMLAEVAGDEIGPVGSCRSGAVQFATHLGPAQAQLPEALLRRPAIRLTPMQQKNMENASRNNFSSSSSADGRNGWRSELEVDRLSLRLMLLGLLM